MTNKAELIVLNHTKFGESSIVLHTLSKEYGRRSFLVKISRKTAMPLFLPLNILEAEVQENNKSTLWRANNFIALSPLNGIRNNLYKNAISLFISEVLYRTVRDGVNEDGLFEWCSKSILTLDAIETDFSNFHLRFLLELASALGFSPTFDDIKPFIKTEPERIRQFVQSSFTESMLIPFSGNDRNEICENLIKYIEYHTDSAINLRSLKVLSELLR